MASASTDNSFSQREALHCFPNDEVDITRQVLAPTTIKTQQDTRTYLPGTWCAGTSAST